jgi:hypothetical protein
MLGITDAAWVMQLLVNEAQADMPAEGQSDQRI